ncbi:MAG: hypothetical protein N2260_02765 [Syntrophobacterales bacterium]|nr:hypothetical protein [Syntrophobacterales bacterium]
MAWKLFSFDGVKTISIFDRPSKVSIEDFAKRWNPGGDLQTFLDHLPRILAGADFLEAIIRTVIAVASSKVVLAGMGAHVAKVGLGPIIIQLLEEHILTGLAVNGAFAIHDLELAISGKTSEDVENHLEKGYFGMVEETARFIHEAVRDVVVNHPDKGLGWAIGKKIVEDRVPFSHVSVLGTAYRLGKPVSVHVAIGTDIVHTHPLMDGASMGELSYRDFRLFCSLVSAMEEGVYINIGSAVILPEVFLKAVSVCRNLGFHLNSFTTIDMDFQRQYRPIKNVVERPVKIGGKGFHFTGHHEIMVPLFFASVIEMIKNWRGGGISRYACEDKD